MKILMLENLVWNARVKVGSHQYCKLFQKKNDVLWMALPLNIFSFICAGMFQNERYLQWNNGKPINENKTFQAWCPLTLVPYRNNVGFRSTLAAKLSIQSCFPSIKKTLKKNNFDEIDVVWISDPRYFPLLKYLNYKMLIYRCVDAFSHFTDIPKSVNELEKNLIESSNIIFATATSLLNQVRQIKNEHTYLLNNGVDLTHFTKTQYNEPDSFKKIKGKKVLFVGALGEWFDTELVAKMASFNSNINYILVGPIRTSTKKLSGFNNIHILGPQPYAEVPNFMHFADACIIPFTKDDISKNVNPIKLYEYFSLGKPCIATKTEEMERIASPAKLADTPEMFYRHILNALKEDGCNKNIYKEFAQNNSWVSRYNFIQKTVTNYNKGIQI